MDSEMSFRNGVVLLVILDIFLFSYDSTSNRYTMIVSAESIDSGWIHSHTLSSYHDAKTIETPSTAAAAATTQTIGEAGTTKKFEINATEFFTRIDREYASMPPSEEFKQFSKIRADALFLQYYYGRLENFNQSQFLSKVMNYFEQWPKITVEVLLNQSFADHESQYLEHAAKYAIEPPPLILRWIIFATWLIKTDEWNDRSKVPEPDLSQLAHISSMYRDVNKNDKTPVIEIGILMAQGILENFED